MRTFSVHTPRISTTIAPLFLSIASCTLSPFVQSTSMVFVAALAATRNCARFASPSDFISRQRSDANMGNAKTMRNTSPLRIVGIMGTSSLD